MGPTRGGVDRGHGGLQVGETGGETLHGAPTAAAAAHGCCCFLVAIIPEQMRTCGYLRHIQAVYVRHIVYAGEEVWGSLPRADT